MKKLLLINYGAKNQGTFFASALRSFYDVTLADFGFETKYKECWSDVSLVDPSKIDFGAFYIYFSIDQHGIPILNSVLSLKPKAVVGVQMLDYPVHVFSKNKDYNARASINFPEYIKFFNMCNFVIHNQFVAIDLLKDHQKDCTVEFIRYPVRPIRYEGVERENSIVFSGRLSPDKGIHYVIDALSLLEEKPKFITIGSGYDFSSYAQFLSVDYLNITGCSNEDKWLLYAKSRFLVCAADTPYISSLCPLEGLSIGRSSVVFNYPENKIHYKNHVFYCLPRDIQSLSDCIRYAYTHPEQCDEMAKDGPSFYEQEASFKVWGERVHNLIERCL